MPRTVTLAVALPASGARLYHTYLDPKEHAAITGAPVKDTLTVHVEVAAGVDESGCSAAAAALAHLVKDYVGINIDVKAGPHGSIMRSLGNAQHVIDKRKCE